MPKQITKTVYEYHELSEKAKERARNWFLESSVDDAQFTFQDTQQDAKEIGLRLTEWDYRRYAKGEFLESAVFCASLILQSHGEVCETYKTACKFLSDSRDLRAISDACELSGDELNRPDAEALEEMEREFLLSLLEDYRILMDKDLEFRQSEEYVKDMMEVNGYTFDENGRRDG